MSWFSRDLKAVEFPEGAEWLNTGPLTLADVRGKIVLLDFWTYCCINCMHVIPDLKRLEEKYPELLVIGVHSAKFANEQVKENIRHAVLRYGIEHPVLIDNDFTLWRAYGIRAWPSFVLIDPVGNVAGKASGEGVYDIFDGTVASLSASFEEQGLLDKEPFRLDLVHAREPRSPLSYPGKLEVDAEGRRLFLSDSNNNRIVIFTPDGEVHDVIGSGERGSDDGAFEAATFFRPQGMAYDPRDDILYVADTENHLVRRADLKSRTVETILGTGHQGGRRSGGRGTDVALNSPWDLTIMGDHLHIAMAGPHQLWRMDLATREAEVYAGSGIEDIVDGPRLSSALAQPSGIDTDGERIFFADSEVSAVRMVEDDAVRTLVGAGLFDFGDVDGPLRRARLQHPIGVRHVDGRLLVADTYNHKVRMIDPREGTVHTLAGSGRSGCRDGRALEAELSEPNDMAVLDGNMYIVDTNNHLVRVLEPASDQVFTLLFTNPERLYPKPKRAFRGAEVALPPVEVALGDAMVHLHLRLPEGHMWNADAPNHLEMSDDADLISVPDYEPESWDWDFMIPIEARGEGSTNLRFRAVAYFCNEEVQGLCRFMALELVLPVTVTTEGSTEVHGEHLLAV